MNKNLMAVLAGVALVSVGGDAARSGDLVPTVDLTRTPMPPAAAAPAPSGTWGPVSGSVIGRLTGAARTAADGGDIRPLELSMQVARDLTERWLDKHVQDLPGWVRRIEFDWSYQHENEPEFSLLTVQPLYQTEDLRNTFFVQGRLARGRDDRTTLNLGAGYRRLLYKDRVLVGLNGFFDHERPHIHQRASLGGEVRSGPFEFHANLYRNLSEKRATGDFLTEEAMDGHDFELGLQVPYVPWARVFVKKFYWDGIEGSDVDGESVTLRIRPWLPLEVEGGWSNDDVNNTQWRVSVRLSLGLGWAPQDGGGLTLDHMPFRWDTAKHMTLDKVRRQNRIIVETVSTATGGTGTATVSISRGT